MSKKEIQESLERLKVEVDALDATHKADKDRINTLIGNLEQQLSGEEEPDHGPMIDQIDDTVTQLEVEHPTITGILNGIATTLSNYGI
jgi:hypothetical protein